METIMIRNFNRHYEDLTAEELLIKYYQIFKDRPRPKQREYDIKPKIVENKA